MTYLRLLALGKKILLAASLLAALPAAAAEAEFKPKAETYICPSFTKPGVDCFLEAVDHLYTMCRQVKSIEVIEFGLEHAEEGVNGSKSEYCVDNHRTSISRFYQAALKEASGSKSAVEALKALHAIWLGALTDLKWHPPESSTEYQERLAHVYDTFHERATVVRTAMAEAPTPKAKSPAKPQPTRKTASAQQAN